MTEPISLLAVAGEVAAETGTLAVETSTEVAGELATASEIVSGMVVADTGPLLGGSTEELMSLVGHEPGAAGEIVLEPAQTCAAEVSGETSEGVPITDSTGIVRHRVSEVEAAHYDEIGLRPQHVGDQEALIRDDIDWDQKDAYGKTNLERAEAGKAPRDPSGRAYELHHIDQKNDGMLAELTRTEHIGKGNKNKLHDPSRSTEIDRVQFRNKTQPNYWRERARQIREARQ